MQIKRHKNNVRTNVEPTDEMTKQLETLSKAKKVTDNMQSNSL